MKSIKKSIFIVLAVLLSANYVHAQQLGVQAGFSFDDQEDMRGFHLGPTYEWNVSNAFSVHTGLLYNYLTTNVDGGNSGMFTSYNSQAHYVDVPLRAVGSLSLGSDWQAFLFAGPNFSISLSHKLKDEGSGKEYDILNASDNNDGWGNKSRFNLQLGAGVGVMYRNAGLRIGFDEGIVKVYKNAEVNFDRDLKSSRMKIGLFYNFPGK